MFDDFEERFSPKCVGDIVFANEQRRHLIEDLITIHPLKLILEGAHPATLFNNFQGYGLEVIIAFHKLFKQFEPGGATMCKCLCHGIRQLNLWILEHSPHCHVKRPKVGNSYRRSAAISSHDQFNRHPQEGIRIN